MTSRQQSLADKKKLKNLCEFADCVEGFLTEFRKRFTELKSMKTLVNLVSDPLLVLTEIPFLSEDTVAECQLELIDIQSNDALKGKHSSESTAAF